ncbi:Putative iron(III) ABC transporter, ATP-binding protein (plasmid) [Pseudorhizobium banfieldiae]|uniref:Iron ABC transporter ATP-binding protein n=2 Tax=Pseudorhizobium TaxID=1903858 RepID=A0ABN7JYC7_9HYPH|nr:MULTISPECIES: ATP-binding cassette domain-containing protein [Pseudorhizobium]CAD6628645.1 iron ABC transporter ATP-binding protein [arsenite-oxidising bacterium NT-25]CAD7054249.1 iron ABC transporter ATP-binding protein [Pseudorhizobium halotolerans]CCF22172.1 Putative iron(III) ABC transporter, ATP-binding protein [Pseudorhizobium banfieldiae]
MIRIENVSFSRGSKTILQDVSLDIPKGGITALVGANGAGKSTLLSLIARLQPLQAGQITAGGLPVHATPSRELAKVIAILRQEPLVTSRLRVRELVSFGRFPHGRGKLTNEDHALVERALQQFDLTDLADRFLETLSGGQRQRALVAMTIAQDTEYLLLDEPLNNLDMYFARELMRSLKAVSKAHGKTVVIVLHDVNQAASHADRIVAMKDGRVVANASAREILTPPMLFDIFGFEMEVETINGTPVVLHFQ